LAGPPDRVTLSEQRRPGFARIRRSGLQMVNREVRGMPEYDDIQQQTVAAGRGGESPAARIGLEPDVSPGARAGAGRDRMPPVGSAA